MTDHDLNRLKELPVPSPREGAKAAALNAGLKAFSQATTNLSGETQESPELRRPTTHLPRK
jgi:hypothetical protein